MVTLLMNVLRLVAVSLVVSASAFAQEGEELPLPPPPPDYDAQQYEPQYDDAPQYREPYRAPPRKIKDWDPNEPVPPGYTAVTRPRLGLVIPGSIVFGVSYVLSFIIGLEGVLAGFRQMWPLMIPVAGPFIGLGTMPGDVVTGVLLTLDGIAQVAGATMFIIGLAAPSTILVRNRHATLMPVPILTSGGAGVGLAGSF